MHPILTISGETMSLKNSKQIGFIPRKKRSRKFGTMRPIIVSSKQYKRWHKAAMKQLKDEYRMFHHYPWQYPVLCRFTFYRKTRRKFDIHNVIQGPLDALVEAKILAEDDYKHVVADLAQTRIIIDKQNPRVEIEIEEGRFTWSTP